MKPSKKKPKLFISSDSLVAESSTSITRNQSVSSLTVDAGFDRGATTLLHFQQARERRFANLLDEREERHLEPWRMHFGGTAEKNIKPELMAESRECAISEREARSISIEMEGAEKRRKYSPELLLYEKNSQETESWLSRFRDLDLRPAFRTNASVQLASGYPGRITQNRGIMNVHTGQISPTQTRSSGQLSDPSSVLRDSALKLQEEEEEEEGVNLTPSLLLHRASDGDGIANMLTGLQNRRQDLYNEGVSSNLLAEFAQLRQPSCVGSDHNNHVSEAIFTEGEDQSLPVLSEPIKVRSRGKLVKQAALPSLVRDGTDTKWVALASMGNAISEHFRKESNVLARATSHWKEFARLMKRPDRYSGGYCIQCNVISHAKHKCDLEDGTKSCTRCIESGRTCAKMIKVDGTDFLGWLPLPEESRGEIQWQDPGYWLPGQDD